MSGAAPMHRPPPLQLLQQLHRPPVSAAPPPAHRPPTACARATACRELSLKEAEMRCRALKDASARAHAAVDQAAADLSAARSRADGFKRALESAKAARDAEAPDTPELRAALQAAGLPGSVEGVDEAVRDAEAERDAIANTNPNVLREYNARQQSIQNLSKVRRERRVGRRGEGLGGGWM
eukprot:365101-Chlamydomonas_euryale.AAC.4